MSVTDQVCLGCTQRAAQVNNIIVMEKQRLFSKLISTSTNVKTEEKHPRDIAAWSYDMEGHAQNCVERNCELVHNTIDQLHKSFQTFLDEHQIQLEDLEIMGEMSEACCQIVLKYLYVARIGRPDLLWTVNYVTRSVTTWNHAIFDWHVSSATFITQLTTCSKTPILQEIQQTQHQHQVAFFCVFLDHIRLCQFHGLVRNRQLYPTAALNVK